jgi:hypothetical protein
MWVMTKSTSSIGSALRSSEGIDALAFEFLYDLL